MIGVYLGTNRTHTQICIAVKGSNTNKGASNSEVASAIKYATNYRYNCSTTGVQSRHSLEQSIDGKIPQAIKMQWNSGGALALVVSGYCNNRLRLIDPAGSTPTNYYYYTALVNGTTIGSGKGYYSHTWLVS